MSEEKDGQCCSDCKENERLLDELHEQALGKLVSERLKQGPSKPLPKRLPVEYINLEAVCEGKTDEIVEIRMRSDKACKPTKMIVWEPEEDSAKISISLKSTGKNIAPPDFDPWIRSGVFSPNALSCGIALPNLYIDEEYIFQFKFEKDAQLRMLLACVAFKDPNTKSTDK